MFTFIVTFRLFFFISPFEIRISHDSLESRWMQNFNNSIALMEKLFTFFVWISSDFYESINVWQCFMRQYRMPSDGFADIEQIVLKKNAINQLL